jgi:hypothetical protein
MIADGEVESIKLDITNNWTGMDELPFEMVAERVMEIESEGQRGELTVSFGKPVLVEGKGWACVFRMSAMGRVHVSPARGADSLEAMQAAVAMAGKQLAGMGRHHRITLNGSEELGFADAAGAAAKGVGCPVMSGTMSA